LIISRISFQASSECFSVISQVSRCVCVCVCAHTLLSIVKKKKLVIFFQSNSVFLCCKTETFEVQEAGDHLERKRLAPAAFLTLNWFC
jgi:hypothetical protein